jgi:nucleotide-binding universal stress UspA family protein
MFRKALIATDLSAASFAVVKSAKCLLELGVEECLLVQCLNLTEISYPVIEAIRDHLDSNIAEQEELLLSVGFDVNVEITPGYAKTEINRLAEERECDLIVVGSQGQSLMGSFLLGGVAAAVIHHATRPVLLVPVRKAVKTEEFQAQIFADKILQHVLFPTDFSDFSDRAFEHLKKMSSLKTDKITLYHVQDRIRIEPHLTHRLSEFNVIDQKRLNELTTQLDSSVESDIKIVFGHAASEILREIEESQVSLVVMGSRGRGFVGEMFLGSVSHNVARRSGVPVLMIN